MAIQFHGVSAVPLAGIDASAPDGAVIGIIGEDGSGKGKLLRLAAGLEQPESGTVEAPPPRRFLGISSSLQFGPVGLLAIEHTLAPHDYLVRERAAIAIDRLRRAGATILLVSHEEDLLRDLCDEVWWLLEGKLAGRGDPVEMLAAYRRHVSARLRNWGESIAGGSALNLPPRMRRGNGRAEILAIELVGESSRPTIVWRSGELATVRITVRFHDQVANPVIGILVRNRVGLNVYGTNTELEGLRLGPCSPDECLHIEFTFRCDLCPQQYTLTVASHDPDGVWHDWLEDAVAFSVVDSRHTAGVANLRAQVTCRRE